MEAEETTIIPRDNFETKLNREAELLRGLDCVAEVLAHFAENVNRLSGQARLLGMENNARLALFLYAALSGALAFFNRDRKG